MYVIILSCCLAFVMYVLYYNVSDGNVEQSSFNEELTVLNLEFENNVENSVDTVCGNDCDAKIHGDVIFIPGVHGKAIKFHNNTDGWISIPHNENLNFNDDDGITLSFWVMANTHELRHNMIYNKGNVGWGVTYTNSINGLYEGDVKKFQALWTGNNNQYLNLLCYDDEQIQLGEWYFITHVLENDRQTLRQYINGKEYCNAISTSKIYFDNTDDFHLGRVIGTYEDKSDLMLDNFYLFAYSLSREQVYDLYHYELSKK